MTEEKNINELIAKAMELQQTWNKVTHERLNTLEKKVSLLAEALGSIKEILEKLTGHG